MTARGESPQVEDLQMEDLPRNILVGIMTIIRKTYKLTQLGNTKAEMSKVRPDTI